MNIRPRDSCRKTFKTMEIMTFYSQYIYALLLFMTNNKHLFMTNNYLHEYKTRIHNILHLPVVNLVKFDKGEYITGIKVFNHLPQSIEPGWHFMYELFKVLKVMTVIETVCVYMCLICPASSGTVWSLGSMCW
jgi:hypothetical protein